MFMDTMYILKKKKKTKSKSSKIVRLYLKQQSHIRRFDKRLGTATLSKLSEDRLKNEKRPIIRTNMTWK